MYISKIGQRLIENLTITELIELEEILDQDERGELRDCLCKHITQVYPERYVSTPVA